jgi:hypothetical protein
MKKLSLFFWHFVAVALVVLVYQPIGTAGATTSDVNLRGKSQHEEKNKKEQQEVLVLAAAGAAVKMSQLKKKVCPHLR